MGGRRGPGRPAQAENRPQPQPSLDPGGGQRREDEHLRPGGEFAGHGHELGPDLVLREAVQREVTQAGVFRAADPVLTPGSAPVPQLQVGELAAFGAGGERR